jgi:hypothetical protein
MRGQRLPVPVWLPAIALVVVACGPGCRKRGDIDVTREGTGTRPTTDEATSFVPETAPTALPSAEAGVAAIAVPRASTDSVPEAPATESARMVRGAGYEGMILTGEGLAAGAAEPWTPSTDDVAAAERLVREQLPGMAASPAYQQEKVGEIVVRLPEYRRQYVARRGPDGHRVLWINFFRSPDEPDWTAGLVVVRGGGHDYFNLEVDLDAGACRALQINSPR